MERKWYKDGQELLDEIEQTTLYEGELAFWYLGQCGFAFKKRVTVYIDAVLTDMTDAQGKTRRWYPSPFAPEQAVCDYFIVTHGHRDHLAAGTVEKIATAHPDTFFIAPGDCTGQLRELGVKSEKILTAEDGKPIVREGLTVYPLSAAHPEHRVTEAGEVALSYFLDFDGIGVLHCGDTYLTQRLLDGYRRLPSPDVFLPPINGGDYFRTARNCIGNLNPREAATLAVLLKAGLTVPTHYDMVYNNTVDPLFFVRELTQQDTAAPWKLPTLGERILVRKHL